MEIKEKITWFIVHNIGQETLALYSINKYMIENGLEKFGNKEVENYIVKELKKVGEITFSRDLSRPIAKNTIGSGESYKEDNKEWYEGKGKDKKITLEGYREIEKIESYIDEQINIYLNSHDDINTNRINEKTDSKTIEEIVNDIRTGVIAQIPAFQREYVWNYESVAPLLLSILKDYPIGALLYWYEHNNNNYVILDGLQRTFSLTLIDNHNYAYIDYKLYKFYVNEKLKTEPFISENEFNKRLIKWKASFNSTTEETQTEEYMFEVFNHNPQIISLVKFIKYKWNIVKDTYSIPFIRLNSDFKKEEAADIFNIINSTGKDLNKLEVNSSIWSKTPIILDYALTEEDNLIKWKRKKENNYRNKIKVDKSIDVLIDTGNQVIEVADFIYSTFEMASQKCPLIKANFYDGDRINSNAIEPLITIYINYFMVMSSRYEIEDHDKMMPLLGQVISSEIVNKESIEKFIKNLSKALKTVEEKLSLLKAIAKNSSSTVSIPIPVSLLSLLINISLSEKKKIKTNLIYIFTHEYFVGSYSTGSTKNAWSEFKKREYHGWNMEIANQVIKDYIDEEHNKRVPRKSYDNKMVFVLALFKQLYIKENFTSTHQVDHIVPKAIIELGNGRQNKLETNHLNSFYNLQLLRDDLNNSKNSDMTFNKQWFTFMNIKDDDFNVSEYEKAFKNHYSKVKKSLCKIKGNGKCGKMNKPVFYDSFEKLIKFQKSKIEPLIEKGLFK